MKRLFFYLASLTVCYFQGFSQVEIRLDGLGPDISGGVHSVTVDQATLSQMGGVYSAHFVVTNNSGSDQKWRVVRKKIAVPATWEDQVCWPPTCYNATGDIYTTPSSSDFVPEIINGSDTTSNGEMAEIKPNISIGLTNYGQGRYRYYLMSPFTENLADSVDLEINFVLGLNETNQKSTLTISPNPANDFVTIDLSTDETSSVKIVDALGVEIYTSEVFSGSKKIDLSPFRNGVYFVFLRKTNSSTSTQKLIIKH